MIRIKLKDNDQILEESEFSTEGSSEAIKYLIWLKSNIMFNSYGSNKTKEITITLNGIDILSDDLNLSDDELDIAFLLIDSLDRIEYMMHCNKQILQNVLNDYNDHVDYTLKRLRYLLKEKKDWDDDDLKFYNKCYVIAQKYDSRVSIKMYNIIKEYVEI